jgi:hypothetical protein
MRLGAICLWMLMAASAQAETIRVRSDHGGFVQDYAAVWGAVAASGANVRIEGVCNSACTIFLGIVPPDRVCVTRNASLGFHVAARWFPGEPDTPDQAATAEMVREFYPAWVQSWIASGPPLGPRLRRMGYTELRRHYRTCN